MDDVIPLNEIGKIETVKVYNQSYINKQQKRITELGELLNSTLEENKDIYKKMADLDTSLEDCTESLTDARIKIKELEKENEELKERNAKLKGMYAHSAREAGTYEQFFEKEKKENEELKDKLNNLSKVAEVRLANWQKYEQENAELKERADKADLDSVTFFNQLCKAKEIIKDFLSLGIFGIFKGTTAEEIVDKAEQFLKENK